MSETSEVGAAGSGPETAQTLDRGLRLLALVAEHPAGVSVSSAAATLGVGRTVVYRLAATLTAHGLLRRDGSGPLRLGVGVLALARRAQPLLAGAAMPVLRALAEELGATAHLTVEDGGEALALLVVEPSWTAMHVAYRTGSRHPLDRAAGGLAILAGRRGDHRWTSSSGDFQKGAYGVAAPLVGVDGLAASVGVVAFDPIDDSTVGPRLQSAAEALVRALTS
ncbi:MAG: helix-turn-helix domain-containing protein [Actinocatenispora sp.]